MTNTFKLITSSLILVLAILGIYLTKAPPANPSTPAPTPLKPTEVWVQAHAPVIGPKEAAVTLVEFIDPACEACRAMYPYVKTIMKKHPNDVRLVIRYVNFHTQSEAAIRILEAARKQNQFETVLEVLLAFQPAWAPHHKEGVDPWLFVAKTDLNIEQAKQDALNPQIADLIALDMADVEAAGVQKTPSFFVNGEPLKLMHPDPLLEMIETALKAAQQPAN